MISQGAGSLSRPHGFPAHLPDMSQRGQPPISDAAPLMRWGRIVLVFALAALCVSLLYMGAPFAALAVMAALAVIGAYVVAHSLGRPRLLPSGLIHFTIGLAHLALAWTLSASALLWVFPIVMIGALVSRPGPASIYAMVMLLGGVMLLRDQALIALSWEYGGALLVLWGCAVLMIGIMNRLRCKAWRQSITDPLTKAFNRRYLDLFVRDHGRDGRAALLLLDLDHFKTLNDQKGHSAGDRVLVRFVRLVRVNWASEVVCFRLGGDEFALILQLPKRVKADMSAREQDRHLGRLARTIVKTLNNDGSFSVSAGLAHFSWPCEFEEVFRRADFALYHAKENGRGRLSDGVVMNGGPSETEAVVQHKTASLP